MTAAAIILILLATATAICFALWWQPQQAEGDMGSTAQEAGVRLAPDLEAVAAAAEAARKAERRRWL